MNENLAGLPVSRRQPDLVGNHDFCDNLILIDLRQLEF